MNFTVESLEFYLLILIRIASFIMSAPFFSYSTIPIRIKLVFSIVLSLVVIPLVPVVSLNYTGVVGYAVLVLKESIVGMLLGLVCSICLYIISFAGQLIDMEIGLSMASMFDPLTHINVSITGNMYTYLVMLLMMVSNMHYFIIHAILDTFQYFNIGQAVFQGNAPQMIVSLMGNYFIIGFRIILPMFACMLVINVVLGVLTRAAPQMNMFVVGIQLKLLVGILVFLLIIPLLPTVTQFIFDFMKGTVTEVYKTFLPRS